MENRRHTNRRHRGGTGEGGPQQMGSVIAGLLARRGYAQVSVRDETQRAWATTVGDDFAGFTRAGNVRRGELEVFVQDSTVLQELTFIKAELLKKIAAALPDRNITKLRLKIGAID
jgi:predicted nucleic acid-binding Zn ribbon protein